MKSKVAYRQEVNPDYLWHQLKMSPLNSVSMTHDNKKCRAGLSVAVVYFFFGCLHPATPSHSVWFLDIIKEDKRRWFSRTLVALKKHSATTGGMRKWRIKRLHAGSVLYKKPTSYTASSECVIYSLFSALISPAHCDHEAAALLGMEASHREDAGIRSAQGRGEGLGLTWQGAPAVN